MALRAKTNWTLLMWAATVLIVVLHGLLWVGNAMTLSEATPHESFLTSLGKVVLVKLYLIEHSSDSGGWLNVARHAIWELTPAIQIVILCLHYVLRGLPRRSSA